MAKYGGVAASCLTSVPSENIFFLAYGSVDCGLWIVICDSKKNVRVKSEAMQRDRETEIHMQSTLVSSGLMN